jgi:uncharacterized protein YaaW (UPF0174 family)
VDDLRAALNLATEEELADLAELLFRPRFNPFDYLLMPRPEVLQGYDRLHRIERIEQRFRFLAADGFTVLAGQSQTLSYRHILMQVCHYLKIDYTADFQTLELEAEILLRVLQQTCNKLPAHQYQDLNHRLRQALQQSEFYAQLPEPTRRDPLRLILTSGGLLAMGSTLLRPWFVRQLATQWTSCTTQWIAQGSGQVMGQVMGRIMGRVMGAGLLRQLQGRMTLALAGRGAALDLAGYSVIRSTFAVLSPLLWGWLALDLGWRSIAINYSRIIPVIFSLAQIRLTRSYDP